LPQLLQQLGWVLELLSQPVLVQQPLLVLESVLELLSQPVLVQEQVLVHNLVLVHNSALNEQRVKLKTEPAGVAELCA
jgi:hypothetical protein